MNDITVEEEIKIIHDIQDDKELFDAQMISNLKKTIADLEDDLNASIDEVKEKDKRITELEAENAIMVKAIDNYAALPHHLSGPAKDVINSIHKLRSEGGADASDK